MSMKLKYTTLDVFTSTRFVGNPLAIVHIPPGHAPLPQEEKQRIAREFHLSETVFLHHVDESSISHTPVVTHIFTTTEELPFAGHPTVGSGWYLLSQVPQIDTVTLSTKAGEIKVVRDGRGVRLRVPTNFKVHSPYAHPHLKSWQPQLKDEDYINGLGGAEAVASIVKGMTFLLLQLSSEQALARMTPLPRRIDIPDLGNGRVLQESTGSAASTLGAWLAKGKGDGRWEFKIIQGEEMGRKAEISVIVDVDGGNVTQVELMGEAVEVMEGQVTV
ncbi:hypothetical protein BD779DRAFT_1675116 [Infundibulicybe gibba]|nr:hypothetical protein BD779DRAFT_1675116 [Infundibulicybe gibba]